MGHVFGCACDECRRLKFHASGDLQAEVERLRGEVEELRETACAREELDQLRADLSAIRTELREAQVRGDGWHERFNDLVAAGERYSKREPEADLAAAIRERDAAEEACRRVAGNVVGGIPKGHPLLDAKAVVARADARKGGG